MVKIKQNFCRDRVTDIASMVRQELDKGELLLRIGQGDSIAITEGSREIANSQTILRELIRAIKERGGNLSTNLGGLNVVRYGNTRRNRF